MKSPADFFGVGHAEREASLRVEWSRGRQYCEPRRDCGDREASAWERAFAEPATVEIGTAGFDPDRLGVGSSPYRGDVSNASLFIPQTPTLAPELRYLFRLAGVAVAAGSFYRLQGIRTAITIGDLILDPVSGGRYLAERVVQSRFWTFQNGNVVYFVRIEHGAPRQEGGEGEGRFPRSLPSMTPELYGTDPALIYAVNAAGIAEDGIVLPYRPPSGGAPPGSDVPGFGLIRDNRFGHSDHGAREDVDLAIPGPCRVTLWASVYQTDPDPLVRPRLPAGASLAGFPEEDIFVQSVERLGGAPRFRHVSGSLVGSIAPYNTPPDSIPDVGQGGCSS